MSAPVDVISPVTPGEKRLALEAALSSNTLARANILRSFLRFVCEREIAGRGQEITEYTVGVEALGRPPDFSPAEDSSVRARAKALREKLQELYASELPDPEIWIDLPKGGYEPRFHRRRRQDTPEESPPDPVVPAPLPKRRPMDRRGFAAGVLLGATAAVLASWSWFRIGGAPAPDPVIRESWGPLGLPNANVLICMGTELYMVVHSYPYLMPLTVNVYPIPSPSVRDVWGAHRPIPEGTEFTMHTADAAMNIGEAAAAASAVKVLGSFGASYQLLPERSTPLPALAGRNLILIGNPQFSTAAARFLKNTPFTVDFDTASRDLVIRERQAYQNQPARTFTTTRNAVKAYSEVFGLLTVMTAQGSNNGRRMVIASGITAVGARAAMEFFASPVWMNGLRTRFRRENLSGFPPDYQVVLRCQATDTQLISFTYETHRSFDAAPIE